MTKIMRSAKGRKPKVDKFAVDDIGGEYAKPGPQIDPDAAAIAASLSEITGRAKTGVVLGWRPGWLKATDGNAFSFYFYEDKLAVDFFNRNQPPNAEIDALADDITQAQRDEIGMKISLCAGQGVKYIYLGPDDEMDKLQLAAKLGLMTCKKGDRSARQAQSGDGITEEESQ